MLKRIISISAGVMLGFALSLGALRVASIWGIFPDRALDQSSRYVREVLELVNENYVDEKKAAYPELTKAALHGMVDVLDPHSEFMEARDYERLEEEIASQFGGIGIHLEMRDDRPMVVAPIAGTPGERAGIQRGDEIISINGVELGKVSIDDVVSKLRGKPKTEVRVGLRRPGTKADYEVKIVREIIKVDSVRGVEMLINKTGYIQITEFSERTAEEFINALNQLAKEGAESLILDLRNNPGGLLDAAVEVAEPFFKKGELIVYTQGRKPADRENYLAESDEPPIDVPVVVLINAGSASASEIVAGALRDTKRGIIVGERSFGKGSVQSIFKLKSGEGMRLTTARYYTPSGITIHEKGVPPHVEVVMTPDEDRNISLQRLRRDVLDPNEFKERFGFAPVEDRQLSAALDILKAEVILRNRAAAATTSP